MTNLGSCGLLSPFERLVPGVLRKMVGTSDCMTSILNLSFSVAQHIQLDV